jgi:hypothetical protein
MIPKIDPSVLVGGVVTSYTGSYVISSQHARMCGFANAFTYTTGN